MGLSVREHALDEIARADPNRSQIFTADKAEVEALPRREVMRFLDQLNSGACKGYLEHIINNLDESGAEFHDRLAELYIGDAKTPGELVCERCGCYMTHPCHRFSHTITCIPQPIQALSSSSVVVESARW